jgi:hypothetical protein
LEINHPVSNAFGLIGEQIEDTQVSEKQVISRRCVEASRGEFVDAEGLLLHPELCLYPSASHGREQRRKGLDCANSLPHHAVLCKGAPGRKVFLPVPSALNPNPCARLARGVLDLDQLS